MRRLAGRAMSPHATVAGHLARAARLAHGEWPLVLGVLQARRAGGLSQARLAAVPALARRLSHARTRGSSAWGAAAAVLHDGAAADHALALARYDRAVGVETLVHGLAGSERRLANRVLADPRIRIYPAGRADLASGRVDQRVLAAIAYLAETFGSVDVSSLISGHRLYARRGVVSAHASGKAVDVVSLGGVPIEGHQEPGGVTDEAIRALLLLPQTLEPAQIISLLALGGPSFSLPDHYDHIHIGYR